MNKIIILISLLLIVCIKVAAETDSGVPSIEVDNISFVRADEQVAVTFEFVAGRNSVRKGRILVIKPILRNGNSELNMPSIVVRHKKTGVAGDRLKLSPEILSTEADIVYATVGKRQEYGAIAPFEEWMSGAELVFRGASVGCCSAEVVDIGLIASNLMVRDSVMKLEIVEIIEKKGSTADMLAEQFAFIRHFSELEEALKGEDGEKWFDYGMPMDMGEGVPEGRRSELDKIVAKGRTGSQTVYFAQGARTIDRHYMDNNKALVELISAVRAIEASGDSEVMRIVVIGYTSPEGSSAINEKLAKDRAITVRDFLLRNTPITPERISIYNGVVDWIGLRQQVEASDMPEKYTIIDIIDNVPVWDAEKQIGRHGQLMKLNSGNPYRYMYDNYFPRLRNSAFIKVYYRNSDENQK